MNNDPSVNYILFTYNDKQKELLTRTIAKALYNVTDKATARDRKIFDSLNDDQKTVFYFLVGAAKEGKFDGKDYPTLL